MRITNSSSKGIHYSKPQKDNIHEGVLVMVKKVNNPLKIDYQNGIIENRLLQIRNFKDVNTPKLSMYL